MQGLENWKLDARCRLVAATALRNMADLVQNADHFPQRRNDLGHPIGVAVLRGANLTLKIGDYQAQVIICEDALIPQHLERGALQPDVGGDVGANGHREFSVKVSVKPSLPQNVVEVQP